jgi:hypothetical protein
MRPSVRRFAGPEFVEDVCELANPGSLLHETNFIASMDEGEEVFATKGCRTDELSGTRSSKYFRCPPNVIVVPVGHHNHFDLLCRVHSEKL